MAAKKIIFFLLISLLLSPLLYAQEQVVTLKTTEGYVEIMRAGQANWEQAATGAKLTSNDKIRTRIESLANLAYPDGTTLTLRENTFLTIQDISQDSKSGLKKRELKLNLGGIKYKVTKLEEKGSEFKIHSSTAIVGITGTEGIITNSGDKKPTQNTMLEGSTYNTDEYGNNGRPLGAGNSWIIDENSKSDKHTTTEEEQTKNEYSEKDKAIAERFNKLITAFNQKKIEGYIIDENILEKITNAMISRDYEQLTQLLDAAEKSLENLKKPTDEKAQKIAQELKSLQNELNEKEKQGYIVNELYLIYSKISEFYQKQEYDSTLSLIEQCRQKLLIVIQGKNNFTQLFNNLTDEINQRAKAGFIVDEAIELGKKADIAFQNGNRSEAEALLEKAKAALTQSKQEIPQDLLKEFEKLKKSISSKKKEGFETSELEELLSLANTTIEDKKYANAGIIIQQIKEKLATIKKALPDELKYQLKIFEDTLRKQKTAGFDLTSLLDSIKLIYETKEAGDFEKLKTLLQNTSDALLNLELPQTLLLKIEQIRKELIEKSIYLPSEIKNLNIQIESALDKKGLQQINALLEKAQTLLATLKDAEPPFLQVSDLNYKNNLIIVSGIAKDNIKLDYVSINGNLTKPDDSGNFSKELLLEASLKEIAVAAYDAQGNQSPEIKIPVPEEKIPEPQAQNTGTELNAKDIKLDYTKDAVIVNGKASPGANINANGLNITADSNGQFSFLFKGSPELIKNGITLTGNTTASEIKLNIEDKWLPEISNVTIQLYDNMPPVLKTDDIIYDNDKITVKGNCLDTANITVQGTVKDIGTTIEEISINGETALLENTVFKHTLLLKPELKSAQIKAIDEAGNQTSLSQAVDISILPAIVKINGSLANISENGDFSAELNLDENLKEVTIQAEDNLKNETTPIKLIVADRIPPRIILGDIYHQDNFVIITGQTEPYSLIYDKTAAVFSDKISTDAAGLFMKILPQPKNTVTAVLIAQDPSGNLSEETNLTIGTIKDEKPPFLTVANLNFENNNVIVSGTAEDDTGIKTITINDEKVDLTNNIFTKKIPLSEDLIRIVVTAIDLADKTTSIEKIITDTQKPSITLEKLSYENGFCVVKGTATDNIGIKEVRVNNVPVSIKIPEGENFEYQLPITAGVQDIIATAIDLYGNFQETKPENIVLPADEIAPVLTLNELSYNGSKVVTSGTAHDNVGLKIILINDKPVNFYEDGSFKIETDIKINPPDAVLNGPIYEKGFVLVSGRVNPPVQEPTQITAIAEDLAGNKSIAFKKDINAVDINQFKILVNNQPVDLENSSFKTKVLLEKGLSEIPVKIIDSLGNFSEQITLPLEKAPPLLTLDEPVYVGNTITISGKATDSASGLAEILINNTSTPFDNDGKFSKAINISESTIVVMALDNLGNAAQAAPIKVSPPDKSAPVFLLKINPIPAIIGKDISINIDVLDSSTRLPEILEQPPVVTALLSDNQTKTIAMSGTGASFYGTLNTPELPAGLINLTVKGPDKAGNSGDKTEGLSSFLLNTSDNTAPTFTVTTIAGGQITAGKDIKLNISASETLKSLPKAIVNLPGTAAFEAAIEGQLSSTSFNVNLSIPPTTAPGNANIQLSGAIDLADNTQVSSVIYNFIIQPQSLKSAVPLRIDFSEINPEKILIRGTTSAKTIVRITLADIKTDLAADDNGSFIFFREILSTDLERWKKTGPSVLFNCYATNYAGLMSDKINFNIPLPATTPARVSGGNFTIEIMPYPLEQGQQAQFIISSTADLKSLPRLTIRLSDGKTEPVNITGSGKEFKGLFQSAQTTAIGPAIIEIKGDGLFETRPYRITSSSENYALLSGAGFFSITASPDPLPQGKELNISVYAQRPVSKIPTLNIRLPSGKTDNIILSGEKTEFRGKYLLPKNTPVGPAELIVNMNERNELKRPFGIAPPGGMSFTDFINTSDIFVFSNPMPMLTGAPAAITVKSGQALTELPSAEIRLNNGQIIPVTLTGNLPGNIFNGQVNILKNAPFGAATIAVKDKKGVIIAQYPTGIAPAFASTNADVETIMIPSTAIPGKPVIININSRRGILNFLPNVKLILADNTILSVNLEPDPPAATFRAVVNIPAGCALGPVRIIVTNDTGNIIGGGQGQVALTSFGTLGGGIKISSIPPNPIPGKPLEITIYSESALRLLPKIILSVPDKSPKELPVEGNVPGNSFRASTSFYPDAKVGGSKIEVRFDKGSGEETQTLFLEGGSGAGPRPPQLLPNPPVVGQPLIITFYAPEIINFLPKIRINYITGTESLSMSGSLPGDTFTATLTKVSIPVKSVDVLDDKDSLIINLPIEMFGGGMPMPPQIEVIPMPLMPGMLANLSLNFPMPVFNIPTANIKFSDGKILPIILNSASTGSYFTGMFSIPYDSPLGQAMLEIYIKGQPVPGGTIPITIGQENFGPYPPPQSIPNPPIIGQPLTLILDIPPDMPMAPGIPRMKINYASGISPTNEYMTVTGAVPGRHFEGYLSLVKGPIISADFIDPTTNEVKYTHIFGTMILSSPTGWIINASPIPPQINQPLNINLNNPGGATQSLLPYLKIYFDDNTTQEFLMAGQLPGANFTYTINPLLKFPLKAEAWNNAKATRLIEMPFGPMGLPIIHDSIPSPPLPGTYTEFPMEFPGIVPFKPVMIAIFSDNTEKVLEVSGTAPSQYYTGKLYATDFKFTNSVRIKVNDDNNSFLIERYFSIGSTGCSIYIWDEPAGLPTERRIHWNTIAGAAGYDIYVSLSNPPTTKVREVLNGSINTEIISSLENGKTYYYTVTARSMSPNCETKSFTAGSGTTGGGNLQLISPAPGPGGENFIEFDNTNASATTNSINISIKNIGITTITAKTLISNLFMAGDPANTISASNINFANNFSIAPSTTSSQNISVSIPSGTASGEYFTPPSSALIIYDDTNNNGTPDTNESSIKLTLRVPVGSSVPGLNFNEGGVNFGMVNVGTNTSINTIHTSNSSGSNLTFVKIILPALYKEGGGGSISSSNVHFNLNSSFSGVLGTSETANSTIYISVPCGISAGFYGGLLRIYNDVNNDNTYQSDTEPSDTLPMIMQVNTPTTVFGFSAADHGTGGTIDLNWSDSATGGHYHLYRSTTAGSQSYGTPQKITSNQAIQITGMANGTTYYFIARNSPCSTHTPGDSESINTTEISATPSISGTDVTPPTFSGIGYATTTGVPGQIKIKFDPASDASTPISYNIYSSTSLSGLFTSTPTSATSSPFYINSLPDGIPYYFAVRAKDNLNNEEKNTLYETVTPSAPTDALDNYIVISPSTASAAIKGTPVLVKLTAFYLTNSISDINTSFSDEVIINVTESSSSGIAPKYIISTQDRVSKDHDSIQMANGVGYFTVEATEATTVTIDTVDIPSSGSATITFSGTSSVSTVSQFALDCDSAAKTGLGGADGTLIWISAIDSTGKIITDYTGTITISITDPVSPSINLSKEKGAGPLLFGPIQYGYNTSDNGEVVLRLKDSAPETVSFAITAPYSSNPTSKSIIFSGVSKFLLESAGQYTIDSTVIGNRIKFIAYAATAGDVKLGGYNGTAAWARMTETIDNNSSQATPSSIIFTNGQAEFSVDDSEYETVTFSINDGGITSNSITANFVSSDPTSPDIREVIAETPFLIHIYFTEETDSTNTLIKTNYSGLGTINKVCWYGNEATLHLASQLTLGSSPNITINGTSPDGIKDVNNNFMGNKTKPFTVPNVDYQGSSYGSGDWLEIQVSPANVPTGSSNVKVLISHKNACGYLTGSNAINKTANVSSINLSYTNAGSLVSPPSNISMSDGKCEFTLNTNFFTVGSATITATAGGVTSGTATITAS